MSLTKTAAASLFTLAEYKRFNRRLKIAVIQAKQMSVSVGIKELAEEIENEMMGEEK